MWEGEEDTVEGDNVLLPSRSMMEASSRKKNTAVSMNYELVL